MDDATTKAMAETLRRWNEAPTAEVIDLQEQRRKRDAQRWILEHARPFKPQPPRDAA